MYMCSDDEPDSAYFGATQPFKVDCKSKSKSKKTLFKVEQSETI